MACEERAATLASPLGPSLPREPQQGPWLWEKKPRPLKGEHIFLPGPRHPGPHPAHVHTGPQGRSALLCVGWLREAERAPQGCTVGQKQNQAYTLSVLIPHAGPQPLSRVASRKHVPRVVFTSTLMTPGPRPRGLHASCPGLAFEATCPQFSAHSQHASLQLAPGSMDPSSPLHFLPRPCFTSGASSPTVTC